MASFKLEMNLFVILTSFLMCNPLLVHSGRVKRVVLTNEEQLQNDLVSMPLDYGMDEEVENIEKEASGEEKDENNEKTEKEQIQVIQKSHNKITKVTNFYSIKNVQKL